MSTHDMEMAFKKELGVDVQLENLVISSPESKQIESYLYDHFSLNCSTKAQLHLLSMETLPNGITHFYIESEKIEIENEIEWNFNLLMNHFPGQQNKLTFYLRDQQHTLAFLANSPTQTLKLETNGP